MQPEKSHDGRDKRTVVLAVVAAALGYFVDLYDLVIFSIVRVKSLQDIAMARGDVVKEAVSKAALLEQGVLLLNMQMGGMLLGGILWGILGDKRGRLSVLFGSIFVYSTANILNGFVHSIESYAALRLIAGVGLAGELGAGITLVSEVMHRESRGYGTTIITAMGICGAMTAVLVGDYFPWRTAYFVGGGLGIALLVLRIGVYESGMFEAVKKQDVQRGNFLMLFSSRKLAWRYLCIILVGVPTWYTMGILLTFSPELGAAMGMSAAPSAGQAIMYGNIGLVAGDVTSGALSQVLKSRRRVVRGFLLLTAACVAVYFLVGGGSLMSFYASCAAVGFAGGYWAVFVTIASEQFGTNIRATATTTIPNFVRGAVVPITLAFQLAKPSLGIVGSAAAVGAVVMLLAFGALRGIDETYGKDLDFLER